MDTPRIALRFRDTTPNVDTIEEHRKILQQEGEVWWGWWRKEFEPPHIEPLNSLRGVPGTALLVDRLTKRCFSAAYRTAFAAGAEDFNPQKVPGYYRADADRVSGWFLLSGINAIDYPEPIGTAIGTNTLLFLDRKDTKPSEIASEFTDCQSRSTVLHLSDLHFGNDYEFLPAGQVPAIGEQRNTLTHCVIGDLKRCGVLGDIAFVLVTGDFTTQGDWSDVTRQAILAEFSELTKALDIDINRVVAIPGNHDVVRYPTGTKVNAQAMAVKNQTRYEHETHFRSSKKS